MQTNPQALDAAPTRQWFRCGPCQTQGTRPCTHRSLLVSMAAMSSQQRNGAAGDGPRKRMAPSGVDVAPGAGATDTHPTKARTLACYPPPPRTLPFPSPRPPRLSSLWHVRWSRKTSWVSQVHTSTHKPRARHPLNPTMFEKRSCILNQSRSNEVFLSQVASDGECLTTAWHGFGSCACPQVLSSLNCDSSGRFVACNSFAGVILVGPIQLSLLLFVSTL